MNWVLIIFVSFHMNAGMHSQQIHFSDKSLCEAAKTHIVRDINRAKQSMGYRHVIANCVKVK